MSALVGSDAEKAPRSLQVRDVLLNRAARNAKCHDHAVKRQMRLLRLESSRATRSNSDRRRACEDYTKIPIDATRRLLLSFAPLEKKTQ